MSIVTRAAKKPVKTDQIAAFIDGATEAKPKREKTVKMSGSKAIISVSLAPEVLEKLDDWAESEGVSRSAAIITAIKKLKRS